MTENSEVSTIVVGLLADPGMATRIVEGLSEGLPSLLGKRVSVEVTWDVRVVSEELQLDSDGRIPIERIKQRIMRREGWDLAVCLTDLPRVDGGRPVLADIRAGEGIALASLPSIGWVRLRPHVCETVIHLIGVMGRQKYDLTTRSTKQHHHVRRRSTEVVSPVRQVPSSEPDIDVHLALSGWRGTTRLVFGMVRDNRPWRLVPSLSKAIAAAAATGAFGIFYPTMWKMADALPAGRLALITAMAVAAMMTWLYVNNGLRAPLGLEGSRRKAWIYNGVTLITLAIGVGCMYVVLFGATLIAAVVVISAPYLETILGHPVAVGECKFGVVGEFYGNCRRCARVQLGV